MKRKIYFFIITLLILLSVINLSAQNIPFPQSIDYPLTIKPNIDQAELNAKVIEYYDYWKGKYLKRLAYQGHYLGYLVEQEGTYQVWPCDDPVNDEKFPHDTTSEAMGYGMIITALMAGYDPQAKTYFDGLWSICLGHPSSSATEDDYDTIISTHQGIVPVAPKGNNLFSWVMRHPARYDRGPLTDSAADGDMDIAYALLLADKQWGSDPDEDSKYNYKARAKEIIDAIIAEPGDDRGSSHEPDDVHYYRTSLGDWDTWAGSDSAPFNEQSTRISDWIPDHFQVFESVTGNNDWNELRNNTFNLLDELQDEDTGLVPDFALGESIHPVNNLYPTQYAARDDATGDEIPNVDYGPFIEKQFTDGMYYYNACRFPWRMAVDYAHALDARGYSSRSKMHL